MSIPNAGFSRRNIFRVAAAATFAFLLPGFEGVAGKPDTGLPTSTECDSKRESV